MIGHDTNDRSWKIRTLEDRDFLSNRVLVFKEFVGKRLIHNRRLAGVTARCVEFPPGDHSNSPGFKVTCRDRLDVNSVFGRTAAWNTHRPLVQRSAAVVKRPLGHGHGCDAWS